MAMPLSLAGAAVDDMLGRRDAVVVGRGRALGRIATGAARRPSTPRAVGLAAAAPVVAGDEVSDLARRELRLGDEPHGLARRDEVDEVHLGVRGDQDQLGPAVTCERGGEVEPALRAECDVDEHYLRTELRDPGARLG